MSDTPVIVAAKASMENAVKQGTTYANWWKTVSGMFPVYGAPGRDEMIKTCQTFWREIGGKFSDLTGDK